MNHLCMERSTYNCLVWFQNLSHDILTIIWRYFRISKNASIAKNPAIRFFPTQLNVLGLRDVRKLNSSLLQEYYITEKMSVNFKQLLILKEFSLGSCEDEDEGDTFQKCEFDDFVYFINL